MPFVPSVVVPPLQPGAAQPGSGYAVPPSQVAGGSLGVRQIIEAGDGILVDVGATTVVSLDTAFTSSLYAPIASPAFTGTPTAPTAALGTNTTQLATTAFVDEAIAAIVVGTVTAATVTFAPTGNIAATNVQAALAEVDAEKAALASPTFTGDPQAPTASPGDNDTSIATTAFVTAAVAAGGGGAASSVTFTPTGSIAASNVQAAIAELDAEKAPLVHTHSQSDITSLVSDLALKAPLASPTFTGNPAAPTPSPGDNDTSIATTAFVTAAVAAGGGGVASTVTFTPTGTIAATDVQAALAEAADEAVQIVGDTMTGGLVLPAGTTSIVPLRIPHGVAHSSPTNGDIWTTTAGVQTRINGLGYQLATTADLTSYLTTASAAAVYATKASPTFSGTLTAVTTQKTAQAVTATASTTINRSLGDYVDLTLGTNITTFAVSNWPASGTMAQVHLAINFTGAFTITWPAAVKWPGATAPTLTGVSGKADHIMLVSDDGGTTIWGFVMGQNYDA